ncbi:DUF4468 domain-containing protein [Sphingobacterium spiritivorum]|uniref:DUF4468 domain-containing protein n=1 Tax=Sphingobacterium spiritivorum TaxID=258 RepID=UPI00191871BC|nr:DUF4468 domain-containing protein [Sphingobacterium spiritivorum]QQT26830.1 DUF4468 domain-containing protein [Sphingobacterium spiritivorum]
MRKYLLIATSILVACGVAVGQDFKLTKLGFVDVTDNNKNFIIIDLAGMTKKDLYNSTLEYISTNYNNPKFVTTKVEGEQIAIDARGQSISRSKLRLSESNIWDLNYKLIVIFKDGKIKVEPVFKNYENFEGSNVVLTGKKVLGNVFGLFNDKGKPNSDKAIKDAEVFINELVKKYAGNIKESKKNSEW